MLKDWILNIKNNSHRYTSGTWKYRISGNILELYVSPQLIGQNREYRCAVVTIGQILRSLSYEAEKSGIGYFIQSFPNLEAPEIIASIRVEDRIENSEDPFPILKSDLSNYSGEERLFAITENFHFDIVKTDLHFSLVQDFHSLKDKSWYVITSKQDNPFTWLNLGNWKESIEHIDRHMINMEFNYILDFCTREEWEQMKLTFPVKDHLQAVIAI